MTILTQRLPHRSRAVWLTSAIVLGVLLASAYLALRPSINYLAILVAILVTPVLLRRPIVGLALLVIAALAIQSDIGTGTAVSLNLATLLVIALLGVWVLTMIVGKQVRVVGSRTNRPLFLFLVAGLLSLIIGNVYWDPVVPRSDHFVIVQLAQWAIFAMSAIAFWLVANVIRDLSSLEKLVMVFLLLAGSLALIFVPPSGRAWIGPLATYAIHRTPFWVLLAGMAGGQLLFNRRLSRVWRVFLGVSLLTVAYYAFVTNRDTVSNLLGVAVVLAMLFWLRFPRLRWAIIVLTVLLIVSNQLLPALWEFGGGEDEWDRSGGSRMVLIQRVVEVTMRNPITGLGPAAYRPYSAMAPLLYNNAVWPVPIVSSHNNFVDLFSHVGIVGLALFFWFVVEIARLGTRLRQKCKEGFSAGYVNGVLAAAAGSLAIMALGDWILPFVYNIGFAGFQASVLVWLFLGGLVALDHIGCGEPVIGTNTTGR